MLEQHYALTLNDTPFRDESMIEQHIDAGIVLADVASVWTLSMGRISMDIDGIELTELIDVTCDNGCTLRVVKARIAVFSRPPLSAYCGCSAKLPSRPKIQRADVFFE